MKNRIIVFIPARGGSKGIPKKNIKSFVDKPLIAHSIEYALSSKLVEDVIVSTDDKNISQISKEFGANVINRPSEFAADISTTESAIDHYINSVSNKPEIIVLLQATSPIRPKGSLDEALEKFINGDYDSLLSISPTHKFFWRVKDDGSTYSEYDYMNRPRRQDLICSNQRFVENGSLYIFSANNFIKTNNRLGGKIGYVIWPEEYSLEIDTPLDFKLIETIYNELNNC